MIWFGFTLMVASAITSTVAVVRLKEQWWRLEQWLTATWMVLMAGAIIFVAGYRK